MISSNTRRLPIGAIVRLLETTLDEEATIDNAHEQASAVYSIYEDFDRKFGGRADYRLWRSSVYPYFAIRKPLFAPPQTRHSARWWDWTYAARQCLHSQDPLVLWSTIALAPDIMRDHVERHDLSRESPIWWFAGEIHRALRLPLRPLRQCPTSCAMAAVGFLIRYQNIYGKAQRTFSIRDCDRFLVELKYWLKIVDPDFRPGRRLSTAQIEGERNGSNRLRAEHNVSEFSQLAAMLSVLRPWLSQSIDILTPQSHRLLHEAYEFGVTAWLTSRSRRIDEVQFQMRQVSPDLRRIRNSFLTEFRAHLDLSNAARDAGLYLESAKHLYLIYRLIPDRLRGDEEVTRELRSRSATIRYLKEAGLEIDPRFDEDEDSPHVRHTINRKQIFLQEKWERIRREPEAAPEPSSPQGDQSAIAPCGTSRETGFMLRVRQDQQRLQEWRQIFTEVDPTGETPIGFLLTIMKSLADAQLPASPNTLRAAFQIALRYGFIRSAGKILSRAIVGAEFPLEPQHLLSFVHHVKRCTQLDPFGMRHDRLKEWQEIIMLGYENVSRSAGLAPHEKLWVHETVVNRTATQYRSLSADNAARLYEKAIGVYDVSELREFYDLSFNLLKKSPGIATVETVAGYLSSLTSESLGAPVAISIMRTPSTTSLIAIAADGTAQCEDLWDLSFENQLRDLRLDAEFWFKFPGEGPTWPRAFRRLASKMIELARRCDSQARVLLLSMDAEMASFPWQHLLAGLSADILVAIVPSLSAMTWPKPSSPSQSIVLISEEAGEEIVEIGRVVRETLSHFVVDGAGVCIVAGHGVRAEEGDFPGVRITRTRMLATLDDWLDVAGSRLTILHCCHGGTTGSLFMNEFGGVPGLAISLGSECFIAPVSEVSVTAASALQRAIFENPTAPVGLSYLEAVRQTPECTLYNIYGNPYESAGLEEYAKGVPASIAA